MSHRRMMLHLLAAQAPPPPVVVAMPTTSTPRFWLDPLRGVQLDANGRMQSWTDRIGGLVASQPDAGRRPVYEGNGARFNTSEWMKVAGLNLSNTPDVRLVVALTVLAGNTVDGLVYEYSNDVNGANGGFYLHKEVNPVQDNQRFSSMIRGNAGYNNSIYSAAANQYSEFAEYSNSELGVLTHSMLMSQAGNESSIRARGQDVSLPNPNQAANNTSNFGNYDFNIGARHGGIAPLKGKIGDLLLFDSNLPESELVKWEEYIRFKSKQ